MLIFDVIVVPSLSLLAEQVVPARLLAAGRAIAPPPADLFLVSARLALVGGEFELALDELDCGIAASASHLGLCNLHADIRRRTDDLNGPAPDAAESVILKKPDPEEKTNLGEVMLELQCSAEAAANLAEALTGASPYFYHRRALVSEIEKTDYLNESRPFLIDGISIPHGDISLHNKVILFCIGRRDFNRSKCLGFEARSLGIAHSCALGMLDHQRSSLGEHDQAAIAYQEGLNLSLEGACVRQLVMSSSLMTESSLRVAGSYIRDIFDKHADHFQADLIRLSYHVLDVIRTTVHSYSNFVTNETVDPVLDFGCGTGLVVMTIGEVVGPGNANLAAQRQGRYAHADHSAYEAACNAGFCIERIERPVI